MDSNAFIEVSAFLVKADELASQRNYEQYLDLFTPNGTIILPDKSTISLDQMNTFLHQTWGNEPAESIHLTLNLVITSITQNEAYATTKMLIIDPSHNKIVNIVAVNHELILVGKRWYYHSRTIQTL